MHLKVNLFNNIDDFKYMKSLRSNLHNCLLTRFNKEDLIEKDVFKIATFLDPNFGLDTFEPSNQNDVKNRVKFQLKLLNPIDSSINSTVMQSSSIQCNVRSNNYISFKEPSLTLTKSDDVDLSIDLYINLIRQNEFTDALNFWKCYQNKFPELAQLAKKFLGVQASSASVERMFNFAGHILSNKRRRSSIKLFENLVFLKLNEIYL